MTEIHLEPIDHPSAWTSRDLGGKEALVQHLEGGHLAAIDGLLRATRHLAPQAVTRQEFDHPLLNLFLAETYDRILDGRGAVIITGLVPGRYSEDDFERIYWGFGTHWGKAAIQNVQGDRLGHVRKEDDNPTDRGHRGNGERMPHSDPYPIIGLMCVRQAASGGSSRVVSSLAIHNEILATRPDLLEPLYRAYPYAIKDARNSGSPVTPYKIPVFSKTGGLVSHMYNRGSMERAAGYEGKTLPAHFVEALDYLNTLANSDDFRLDFMLEPGEMVILNNHTTFHARGAFQDSAEQKRHLLRLWLNVPNGRPVASPLKQYCASYEGLYGDRVSETATA